MASMREGLIGVPAEALAGLEVEDAMAPCSP
jgi:hypothetical protein